MINAVEVKKNVWDFSCTNNYELYKAIEISCDKLEIKCIDFSKISFRAFLLDIQSVTNVLSENGVRLCYDEDQEAMMHHDNKPPFVSSGNYSEESLMALKGV